METDYWNQVSAPKPVPPKPKIAVKTVLSCSEQGIMTPLFIFWKDGSKYKVDEVVDIKPRGVNMIECVACSFPINHLFRIALLGDSFLL